MSAILLSYRKPSPYIVYPAAVYAKIGISETGSRPYLYNPCIAVKPELDIIDKSQERYGKRRPEIITLDTLDLPLHLTDHPLQTGPRIIGISRIYQWIDPDGFVAGFTAYTVGSTRAWTQLSVEKSRFISRSRPQSGHRSGHTAD